MREMGPEALVVGGGLAGCIVAIELARAGRQVTLLEASRDAQHKVCGEFLSGEALHSLERHGVNVAELGAVALRTIRLVLSASVVEQPLPFAAWSVTRRRLDEELLRRAAAAGADVQRSSRVESLTGCDGAWCATLRDGRRIRAPQAFLATGKHDLRGRARPPGSQPGLIAFKMYFQLAPQQLAGLGDAIELALFPGGYAGLQPVEHGAVNLCLLVRKERFRQLRSWDALLQALTRHAPHLAGRLRGATPLLDAPLTASHIPYGHLQRRTEAGLWRVGDQAAVIPSFCGDGMAIALHSGSMAARSFLRGETSSRYQSDLQSQLARQIAFATLLSKLLVRLPQAAQVARVFPSLLRHVALGTRIPQQALLAGSQRHAELAVFP